MRTARHRIVGFNTFTEDTYSDPGELIARDPLNLLWYDHTSTGTYSQTLEIAPTSGLLRYLLAQQVGVVISSHTLRASSAPKLTRRKVNIVG